MSENFLNDQLFSNFEKSEKIFIQTENSQYSFKEFNQLCNKIANFLLVSKIKANDRVLVKLEKSVICLAIYIATIRAGCIYIPVNTSYTPPEIDYFIENSQPSLFIANYESIKKISNKNIKTAQLENDLSGPFLGLVIRTLIPGKGKPTVPAFLSPSYGFEVFIFVSVIPYLSRIL